MTLSHDETNARLLELVYDEATPAERAALEAHVATCPACQKDLAALGETRAHLRGALDDVPVPARAHARILEAAAQAVAQAPMAPARAVVTAPAPSLWERLRARWTFPTLATVGAVAVVLIASKVFLDPQRTIERGREAMAPAAPQPAAVTRSDEPFAKRAAPADELGASAERARAMAPGGVSPALGSLLGKGMSEALVRKHRESANRLHGAASSEGSVAGEIAAGGVGTGAASSLGLRGGQAQPAPPAPASAFASPPSDWKGGAPGNGPSARTSPPPMAEPPAPRAAPVTSAAPRRMRKLSDDSLDGLGAGAAAERDRGDDGEKKVAPAKDKASEAKHEAETAPTQEALARRAAQLFAARRWSAAIAAYRDLIRRFPDAELEPRWSARLTQAQAESDAADATKVRAKANKKADLAPVGE